MLSNVQLKDTSLALLSQKLWEQSASLKPAFNHFYLQVTLAGAAEGGGEAATTAATGTATPLRPTRAAARLPSSGRFPTGFSPSKLRPKPRWPRGSWAAGGSSARGRLRGRSVPGPPLTSLSTTRREGKGAPASTGCGGPTPTRSPPAGAPRPSRPPPTRPSAAPGPPKHSALLATGPAPPHRPQRVTAGHPAAPGEAPRQPPSPEGRRGSTGAILPSARRCRLRRTNAGPSTASARPLARGSREKRPPGQSAPGEGREHATIEPSLGPERPPGRAGTALQRGAGTIETARGGPPRGRARQEPVRWDNAGEKGRCSLGNLSWAPLSRLVLAGSSPKGGVSAIKRERRKVSPTSGRVCGSSGEGSAPQAERRHQGVIHTAIAVYRKNELSGALEDQGPRRYTTLTPDLPILSEVLNSEDRALFSQQKVKLEHSQQKLVSPDLK